MAPKLKHARESIKTCGEHHVCLASSHMRICYRDVFFSFTVVPTVSGVCVMRANVKGRQTPTAQFTGLSKLRQKRFQVSAIGRSSGRCVLPPEHPVQQPNMGFIFKNYLAGLIGLDFKVTEQHLEVVCLLSTQQSGRVALLGPLGLTLYSYFFCFPASRQSCISFFLDICVGARCCQEE